MKIHTSTVSREFQFNKLEPMFLGPYPVIKCFPDRDDYTIKTPSAPRGQIKVHASLLTLWFPNPDDQFPYKATPEPGPAIRIAEDSDENRYDVERINKDQSSKQNKRAMELLIKWKCYCVQHNTCKPEHDVDRVVILAYISSKVWTVKLQKKCAYKRAKQ